MKKDQTPDVNVPWGDTYAREINRRRPERVKMHKEREEKRRSKAEKKEMLRRKSAEELESDPRTIGAIEAIKRVILGSSKKRKK